MYTVFLQVAQSQPSFTNTVIVSVTTLIISILTAYFTTLKTIRTERDRIDSTIQLTYANKILDRRLEIYPKFYHLISEINKKLFRNKYTLEDFLKFSKSLDKLDSKFVVFFSNLATGEIAALRRFLRREVHSYEYISLAMGNRNFKLKTDKRDEIIGLIANLENALKHDMGIYIVEFNDPQNKINTYSYTIVNEHTLKRKGRYARRLKNILVNYFNKIKGFLSPYN